MIPLIVLLLIVAVLGGAGFAASWLWFILVIALVLWVIGFFIGGAARTVESGLQHGRRHRQWYGR
jgi:energy-coupling factor transporter transmembrane protein EcfT